MKGNEGAYAASRIDRRVRRAPWDGERSEVSDSQQAGRELVGDFAGADDLLWAAETGRLERLGAVRVARSGRIGPLVEILMARRANPVQFAGIALLARFAVTVEAALARGEIFGDEFRARVGAFPLRRYDAEGDGRDQWSLWSSRAEQAAMTSGFAKPVAAGIIGAMGELQDNVFRHSRRPETGLVAYASMAGTFEIVVADAGVGVLASLRECADYAQLQDAGAALKVAVEDGNSRFGRASGNGFGMGQMFRALANHDGELRFRSDDHALAVRGHSPSLQAHVELGHKARLGGMAISVLCRAPDSGSRGR